MEDLYSIHPSIPRSPGCNHDRSAPSTLSRPLRAQITGHPLYPSLVSAYIDCRKVGAPPELASQLEELGRENHASARRRSEIGVDPELDDFMESYCEVLRRYKEELSKPLDEATCFLSRVEMELNDLCRSSTSVSTITTAANADSSTGAGGSSEEHVCREGEASDSSKASLEVGDLDLKEKLLQKYSGYLSSLRNEFLKKRKKGKLPKDSRLALLDWWNAHYRWPYPTEEEKATLVEMTGLDQRQINNWFINQRKRHWKPSEDMQSALMEGLGSGASGTETQLDTGTTDP